MSKEKKVKKPRISAGKLARREAMAGYLFVLPWMIGVVIFLLRPLFTSFQFSLNNIRITPKGRMFNFVGYQNYTQIWLEDPEFPVELMGYMWSTLLSVPVIVVFALIIAMLLNGKIHMKSFFRLIFFLPVIIVSGPVMNMLVADGAATIPSMDIQAISTALDQFLPHSLVESISELFNNMIMILWYSGVQILIFLSALQKIDGSLYEAAKIDGGSGWECFWKITLPTIKPMVLLNAVYTVIFLSNHGNNAIIGMIQNSMFSGTKEKGYGYAAAMAWIYSLVVTLIVLLFAFLLAGRKDIYERQVIKVKRAKRKEIQMVKKIERRGKANAKKIQKARLRKKYRSYDKNRED